MLRIAVVGGGFAGTMAVANLLRQSSQPLHIDWYEARSDAWCRGVAYGAAEDIHRLNVPASRMSAWADEPEHFHQWCKAHGHAIGEGDFAPRPLYGKYLQQLMLEVEAQGVKSGHVLVWHETTLARVSLAGNALQLTNAKGESWQNDRLVLATGNLASRPLAQSDARIIEDVWHPPADLWEQAARLPETVAILLVGTGLTMVDMALSLHAHGFKGKMLAVSRSGLLPQPHMDHAIYPAWEWVNDSGAAPKTADALFAGLRHEIRRAALHGYDWRSVVDALRPVTQTLWQQLPLDEQRRFLRRYFTRWNVHRHRMAPEIAAQIESLQAQGRLTVQAAHVHDIDAGKTLNVILRGREGEWQVEPQLILNCTGPDYAIESTVHPLLKQLRDDGLIVPHPVEVGILQRADGSAEGAAVGRIFPMGALCLGQRFECTAVPELREQAAEVAAAILAHA